METLDARSLMNEVRLFARRHLILTQPVWPRRSVALDPNFIFFAGSDEVRGCLQSICREVGLSLSPELTQGDDFAEARWQDLRRASVGVFDLSTKDPQLFHDLGIALTLGMEVMLIANEGTPIPFDIAQDVRFYSGEAELQALLLTELNATMYGLQKKGTTDSSLDSSLAYAGRLAERHPGNTMLMSLFTHLQSVTSDPVKFRATIKVFNDRLGEDSHLILNPRWPGVYPDPHETRCFVMMPFREDLNNDV